jgi:SAM-dependent methyltransferase
MQPQQRRTPSAAASARRRRRVRTKFDAQVDHEWARYSGEAWRVLVRELRDRFLARHLPKGRGWVLELGPGPGRFTPTVLASGARVVAVDLSLPMLHALRRRKRVEQRAGRLRRVRGAGEHLPFREGAFRAAVVYGNILGFSAGGGEQLLSELARVVRRGGVLIVDVSSSVAAITEFLSTAARRRFLLRILRDPEYFLFSVHANMRNRSHQPYAPERLAFWEFDFYTVAGAESAVRDAGFRPIDRMAVGAIGAFRDRMTTIARRERRTWKNLLELEEVVGRRPGVLETGHGFVLAAVRSGRASGARSRA